MCEHAYNAELGEFTQTYDSSELDAAVLMIPLVGFLPGTDPRVVSTIDVIRTDRGGAHRRRFVMRYVPTHDAIDGIAGEARSCRAASGWSRRWRSDTTEEDAALFERLLTIANDVGLYAEEYDPQAPRLLGNFPQAFTHLACRGRGHARARGVRDAAPRRDRTHGPARRTNA